MLAKVEKKPDESPTILPPFEKHKPLTTVDFEQQIDYISGWISDGSNTEVLCIHMYNM